MDKALIDVSQQRFAGPCLAIIVVVVVIVVVIVIVIVLVVVVVVVVIVAIVIVVLAVSAFLWFWGFPFSFMVSPLLFYIDFPCLTLSHRLCSCCSPSCGFCLLALCPLWDLRLCSSRSFTVKARWPMLAKTRLRGKLGRPFVCF